MKAVVKGFKGFDKNLACRGFQYEIGKIYEMSENDIEICAKGFHFCKKIVDVNDYYEFRNDEFRYCEIEALGKVIDGKDSKSVTNKIKIVREIPREELMEKVNIGYRNTGYRNTGDCNAGNWNTGDCNAGNWNTGNHNTGYRNTGNCNTGDWNTGNRNTGYCNTGNRNTGYRNTGDWNTGDWNTGYWNKTNRSAGVFCNKEPKLIIFNKETNMTYEEWKNTRAYDILQKVVKSKFVSSSEMTDEEKEKYPSYETCGGYLKEIPRCEASKEWWNNLDNYDKKEIFNLPNFDLDIFNDIMELKITEKEYKEVMK